jgi:hypothetical protein
MPIASPFHRDSLPIGPEKGDELTVKICMMLPKLTLQVLELQFLCYQIGNPIFDHTVVSNIWCALDSNMLNF